MCTRFKTTMACGHTLINYATTCSIANDPRPCTPNVRIQHLNDTCAACDPAARRRRVRQDYESRHAELMALYMAAKRTGDGATMARVELLVMENSMNTMERNFEINMPCQEDDAMWWEIN
ncbi:hypothetical protein F53441_8609 [Fusarium austroafricanum]|uniref:Uncharacterized protein n=1 Tax=Fusarium austroafricanum TaxID=2364996 RepID=A0A8H4KB03_9HYPO|nr:hypothetical protein F53441_8609 [Fusarium austroafricanum]